MGRTGFGFVIGFLTAVGVGYMAYRALLSIPELEEQAAERAGQVERTLRRTH